MPKRTDISTILIIGAGPIVIGQACEFDYSGTQAVKTLKEEGYRIVLVNSNPATIMTDPELADATYIEPITPEIVANIIEKERHAETIRRRDDRRHRGRHRQGRGPRPFPRGDDPDRAGDAALPANEKSARRAARARRHRAAG